MKRVAAVSVALCAMTLAAPAAVQAAETLSITDRLEQRRSVVLGTRAYAVGTEAGRFPAMGFHTRGEMGGIWAPPIKLLDGVWFGIDDQWMGPATRFTSGYGHVRYDLPGREGLTVRRTDFVPDGRRGLLIGLRMTASAAGAQSFTLRVNAHSELMSIYPWGETRPTTQTTFNLADQVAYSAEDGALVFTETGTPPAPNAEPHDWAAAVGTALRPTGQATGADFRGPVTRPVICPASGPKTATPPRRCDDTAYGKGRGGELAYPITIPAGTTQTVWLGVAGSESGGADARAELKRLLADPAGRLRAKIAARDRLAERTKLTLPGDPLLARGIDWSKQNLADSVQRVDDLELRESNAGTRYPPARARLPEVEFLGAGWPDYPWLFATDGEYTAFASVAVGQFEPVKEHFRALRDASLIINAGSGKVVHEVITDGTVYFGANRDAGNTDETAKFPSAVALIWRWTGDDRFRDEMYGFAKANMDYIFRELDDDRDGWPEGLGNVEREGMGEEKLDNTVYTIRGLYDLADLAESKGDRATERVALRRARDLERRFDPTWWMPEIPQHADSLGEDNEGIQQRHWIGVTPMEVELTKNGRAVPGLTSSERGERALNLRERRCYSDAFGMFHTGSRGCDPADSERPPERTTFTLNTAIMSVGEGNYGRLAEQRRFTRANRRVQLPNPDEQPGAMPEIVPSPDFGRNIERPFNERAMVLQAWGAYGTVWPVVHQHLGVRPDAGRDALEVVPQLPPGQRSAKGENIRIGTDGVAVTARARGGVYTTELEGARGLRRVRLGHTLPRGADVASVSLDGRAARARTRVTHRGLEVTVLVTRPSSEHTVRIRTR